MSVPNYWFVFFTTFFLQNIYESLNGKFDVPHLQRIIGIVKCQCQQ
jgi:hypothetical protein